jgi:hypothetical protein
LTVSVLSATAGRKEITMPDRHHSPPKKKHHGAKSHLAKGTVGEADGTPAGDDLRADGRPTDAMPKRLERSMGQHGAQSRPPLMKK